MIISVFFLLPHSFSLPLYETQGNTLLNIRALVSRRTLSEYHELAFRELVKEEFLNEVNYKKISRQLEAGEMS